MSGVFRSGELHAAPAPDLKFEPTVYALFGVIGVAALTQQFPQFFFKKGMYKAGVLRSPSHRALLLGLFPPITGFLFAIDQISYNEVIRGHMLGFASAFWMGSWGLMGCTQTPATAPIGLIYMATAHLYYKERIMLFTDEAPLWNWSDYDAIKEYYAKKNKKE